MSFKNIVKQFNDMLDEGILPCLEFNLGDGEWLVIDMQVTDLQAKDKGIIFRMSEDFNTYFSGTIRKYGQGDVYYLLPYDKYFDNLDYYLETIYQEISEGVILPNDLLDNQ